MFFLAYVTDFQIKTLITRISKIASNDKSNPTKKQMKISSTQSKTSPLKPKIYFVAHFFFSIFCIIIVIDQYNRLWIKDYIPYERA